MTTSDRERLTPVTEDAIVTDVEVAGEVAVKCSLSGTKKDDDTQKLGGNTQCRDETVTLYL